MLIILLLSTSLGAASSTPVLDNITPRGGESCGYDSCPATEPGELNVHLIPHTRYDISWLKTLNQKYGSNNAIQKSGVQDILDSVVEELWEDPKRRFIFAETAFFWEWWEVKPQDVRDKVHTLVRQGRLQFVGGAWSMNDEATTHYQSIIDQFTFGLSKLNSTFGECGLPRVGWQIDPFGHSREFASLLAAMGYDGLFLGRIDYQDKSNRLHSKEMEMVWRGDDDLGESSDIFTGVLYNTSPPPGFCLDMLCDNEPIIDDTNSPLFNVDDKVTLFLDYVTNQSLHYRTNNVLVTMGEDFTYQNVSMWYSNLDRLIDPLLPIKQDDFFPYASDSTAYWTGYFTSRPTTKYFEREGNNYLQMVKQLQVFTGLENHNDILNKLKTAMGMMQHHDIITGGKQPAVRDHERLLNEAIDDALLIARQAFNKVAQGDALMPPMYSYERCRLQEYSCQPSETSDRFVVTVYNPLAWSLWEAIRIPVIDGNYEVYAPNGDKIDSQLIPIPELVLNVPKNSIATHELVFAAYLYSVNIKAFYVQKVDIEYNLNEVNDALEEEDSNSTDEINDEELNVPFDRVIPKVLVAEDSNSTDEIKGEELNVNFDRIIPRQNPEDIEISLYYYSGFVGDNRAENSSKAYIIQNMVLNQLNKLNIEDIEGVIVNEKRVFYEQNVISTTRRYKDLDYYEHEWIVGPIDITDDVKELVVRYQSNILNNGEFYTDSNGRQVLKRKLNQRPQYNVSIAELVAGNYYPVTNEIYIQNGNERLTVLTDRSQGGTSLVEGKVELMLHRRLLHDDAFGVDGALSETADEQGLVRGRHRIFTTTDKDAIRKNVYQLHHQPIVFVSATNLALEEWLPLRNGHRFFFRTDPPDGIHLLTLEPWGDKMLLRLENYKKTSVRFDLNSLFREIKLKRLTETLLAANQYKEDHVGFQWSLEREFLGSLNDGYKDYGRANGKGDEEFDIFLRGKEIRTFIVEFEFIN